MSEVPPRYVRFPTLRPGDYPPAWGATPTDERVACLATKHRGGGELSRTEIDELFAMIGELMTRTTGILFCR